MLGAPSTIALTDVSPIPVATTTPLMAFAGCTDDGPWVDVTTLVSWTSSDASVAAALPFAGGVEALGVGAGTTQVGASFPSFEIEPISVSVFTAVPTALELQPDAPNFSVGDSFPMRALDATPTLGSSTPFTVF